MVAPWNRKARAWLDGRRGIFDRIREDMSAAAAAAGAGAGASAGAGARDGGAVIWMHCSSLGEFEQGRPVIEALRRQSPERMSP